MPITVALEGGLGCTSLEEEQRRPWGLSGQAGSERLTEKKRQIDCLVIMGMKAYCSSLTTQTQAQDNNTQICMVHVVETPVCEYYNYILMASMDTFQFASIFNSFSEWVAFYLAIAVQEWLIRRYLIIYMVNLNCEFSFLICYSEELHIHVIKYLNSNALQVFPLRMN